MTSATIVWFRQDLRLDDNPALKTAIEAGKPVIPLYIHSSDDDDWFPGSASKVWLHHALSSLSSELKSHGSKLVLMQGTPGEILKELIQKHDIATVYWNRCYEPAAIKRDTTIKKSLKEEGIEVESFNAQLLFEPHQIANQQDKPYKVYTPFWKYYKSLDIPQPFSTSVSKIKPPEHYPQSTPISDLDLLPTHKWYKRIEGHWQVGKKTVEDYLDDFLENGIQSYDRDRDFPAVDGVSYLSPFLHYGQIGPRQLWQAVIEHEQSEGHLSPHKSAETWLSQLVWREFAHHLLFHFPKTTHQPMSEKFKNFPWKKNRRALRQWQQGQTGYPIVDAGMRQLWQTGWMHNRLRMIVGSFLVKDLLIHWREGARWFWDTLVDADLANNTMGWQWVAGCGADAAPYFRIFNPVRQGERFDPEGDYVKKWVPELAKLEQKYIHAPWKASEKVLAEAGVQLGKDYPEPIVEHQEARETALSLYQSLKTS